MKNTYLNDKRRGGASTNVVCTVPDVCRLHVYRSLIQREELKLKN